ncbi:MAG TPA: hypothetical protein VFQ22_04620 [Longimicrobiales bacterium]|nr:hypothetical protein [Longimicrobiales bacterium]
MSSRRRRKQPAGAASLARAEASTPRSAAPSLNVLYLPLAATLGLGLVSFLPRVQSNPRLAGSFWGVTLALLAWHAVLTLRLRKQGVSRRFVPLLRPQHYIQACIHASIFAYWGFYWRQVYDYVPLLLGQLLFAYAFDMLLQWSRREEYALGFGPFPIIFSTNLFLWFKDDWFWLQFLMIAVGFLGKELVRWERDGRRVHIFNPSAFTLGLFSLVLIATGTTSLTWGPEVASTLTLAPYIYTWLFATGLIVMYFFHITLVAGAAATVLFALSAIYYAATGVPYFIDSEIPAAVFLGLHLLVTDPSTSPRTPPGKLLFGGLYGAGVFALYALLGMAGAPTFYDKLLCVPLLNLSVRGIDALVAKVKTSEAWARLRMDWAFGRPNVAYMSVWAVIFAFAAATGRADGRHIGDSLPFWQQACEENRRHACERLLQIEATYCSDASAWACNELGAAYAEGRIAEADPELALGYYARACELRYQPACMNVLEPRTAARGDPRTLDLRLLLREGGRNLMETPEPELYDRACEHGWSFACERVALSS